MSEQKETSSKKRKPKDFAAINGSCKMAKLTDGLSPKPCKKCGTVSKMRECPFCHTKRGKPLVEQKLNGPT